MGYAVAAFVAFAINDCVAFNVINSQADGSAHELSNLFVLPHEVSPDPWLVCFHLIQAYVFIPWIVAFYAWLDREPARLLERFRATRVLVAATGQMHVDLGRYQDHRFTKNRWAFLILAGVVIASGFAYQQWNSPPGWDLASREYARILVPMDGFVLYLTIWMILCMVVEVIFVLRKTFNKPEWRLNLRPFDPDNVGGLGPLKQYAGHLVSFIAGLGGYLLIDVLQDYHTKQFENDHLLRVFLWAYALLVPFCFVGSLWHGHSAMVKERNRRLSLLGPVYSDELQKLVTNPASDSTAKRTHLENLKAIGDVQAIIVKSPRWPFDSGNVRHVLEVAFGPWVPILFELLKSAILRR